MLKAFKYRLYPNKSQQKLLDKHFNCSRLVYNLSLQTKIQAYQSNRVNLSQYDLINQLPDLKSGFEFIKEVDSQCLQQSVMNMCTAFKNFFNGGGYPKYKSKHNIQSFKSPHGKLIKIEGDRIELPKFKGGIKLVKDRDIKGVLKSGTVSKSKTGKYFISLLCETGEAIPAKKCVDKVVGIDLGLTHYAITDTGVKYDNPKYLRNAMTRLKVIQRKTSRKRKGSNNIKKAYKYIAISHERISNKRRDFLNKLSTEITNLYDTICLETLNIAGMVRNHNLAGSIIDASWGMFVQMIKYKCEWNGGNILQVGTFQATSKICSCCGYKNTELTLKDRFWTCICGKEHDRDINAAINIKQFCLYILKTGYALPKELVEMLSIERSMKQEIILV